MEQPIVNPANPYVGPLRVFPGTLVKVSGQPKPNATRFAINFQTGPSLNPRDDLALHLSPCFTPPRIVRNSLINGAWGIEEAWSNGSVLTPHAPFEIMILAEHDKFKIAVNGQHYCEFAHRIGYQAISYLTIDGDVDIHRITITSQDAYGSHQPTAPAPSMPSHSAPYPVNPGQGMPMPPMYPTLGPVPTPSGPYPSVPSMPTAAGPAPTPASYSSGYPQAGPYPAPTGAPYQPPPPMGGPAPTGNYYAGGYPN
uniref:Galectin n=1 Tax=Aceria tosichella TaxID=561515 RepID=A0A6G1SPG2_9ACAR